MPDFNSKLTQGAGITVFPPTAAPTSTGSGSAVPSAAVAVMSRGPVGKPFRVTGDDFEKLCGPTLPMRDGIHAEGLRHIRDALDGSEYVDVVRVTPQTEGFTAKFPVLSFMSDADEGSDEAAVTSTNEFGAAVATVDDAWLTIWPTNGDDSSDVEVTISDTPSAIASLISASMLATTFASANQLDNAIASEQRSDKNKARDMYRHPKQTLEFLGFKSTMTVVEITPGGGWYT